MKPRLPFVSLALVATSISVHLGPGWADGLQFDRAALARGEWWRWLTGHLTHFEANHLAWDAGMLAVLGFATERQSRVRCAMALLLAAVTISAAVWHWQPHFVIYRGLSGLDSALFALFAASLVRQPAAAARIVGVAALLALGVKCGLETITGSTVFARGDSYAPVPLAHLVGLGAGAVAAFLPAPRRTLPPAPLVISSPCRRRTWRLAGG